MFSKKSTSPLLSSNTKPTPPLYDLEPGASSFNNLRTIILPYGPDKQVAQHTFKSASVKAPVASDLNHLVNPFEDLKGKHAHIASVLGSLQNSMKNTFCGYDSSALPFRGNPN